MSIADNISSVRATLNPSTTLVAVSKTHPLELIQEAYEAGQRDFGENKVQEMCEKQPNLPDDIRWHLIGHLQTNKVKYVAPFVYLIHSVDSLKLLKEINKRAAQLERTIGCLLQVHIADEDTKFGLNKDEIKALLESPDIDQLVNVQIRGLMGMATFTEDEGQIAEEFEGLRSFYNQLKQEIQGPIWEPEILSMGMSGDYLIAQEHGSNMVRVGSSIFGDREYR